MKHIYTYLLILVSLLVACCGQNNNLQNEKQPTIDKVKAKSMGCFLATLGKKEILFELFSVQDSVFGRYCYTQYKNDLSLNGHYDSEEGVYTLYESFNGNKTGIWKFQTGFLQGTWTSMNSQKQLKIIISDQINSETPDNAYSGFLTKLTENEKAETEKYKNIWTKSEYQGYMNVDGRVIVSDYGVLNILGSPNNYKIKIHLGYYNRTCANGGDCDFIISKDFKSAYSRECGYKIIVSENNRLRLIVRKPELRCSLFDEYIKVK